MYHDEVDHRDDNKMINCIVFPIKSNHLVHHMMRKFTNYVLQ